MSNSLARNGIAPNNASHRLVFHCAAVALALAAATVITIPKLETTAAVSAADTGVQTVAEAAPEAGPGCLQSWPYYERSCLHDSRQQDGNGRSVRLIATGRPAARHATHQ